jgi:hypothetical protein
MIESGQKTSLLVPSQLPEFIRDNPDYSNFVLFLQAYYEWLEETNNVTDRTKNLLNYKDIDETTTEFLNYFYNDFLSYFPTEILADKQKVIKIAKELYQSKGTPASFQFLFRILYNSDVDFFYTKDAVLKASSGKWYVAKSLKLASDSLDYLATSQLRIIGETTKSIATIETAVITGNKVEIFISDIQRLFQSGEISRVVDANNQDVYFKDGEIVTSTTPGATILRSKIVGQISQLKISPTLRGLLYRPGDPVVVEGGLNSPTGLGATAIVGTTTSGSIQRINVTNGGYGFRTYPNSVIEITNGGGALAIIGSLDPSTANTANVSIPVDLIGLKTSIAIGAANYNFANIAISDATTTLNLAFTFLSFTTNPISSVLVQNSGGGISQLPTVQARSYYDTEAGGSQGNLASLGILAPIKIVNTGRGYSVNDTINIIGGSGFGARANVTSVNAIGSIETVSYVLPLNNPQKLPLGGMNYRPTNLPTLSVANNDPLAINAELVVPGILGAGAEFEVSVDRVGSITSISLLETGEDYIAAPNVSLKVQDIVVSNVIVSNLPQAGDIVYQGTSNTNFTYQSTVSDIELLVPYSDPIQSLWRLRTFNYNSLPVFGSKIKVDNKTIVMDMSNKYPTFNVLTRFDSSGVITYGDGTAKANASFLNGLVISQGQYLDTTGQPSSFDVLQDENYNNYTYQITLEKEIDKYRTTLLNLVHPTGMKVIGRYALKSNSDIDLTTDSGFANSHTLYYNTQTNDSNVSITSYGDFSVLSSNIIKFDNLFGANIATFVFPNNTISFTGSVFSEINTINYVANTITIKDNVWLTFANVASATANIGQNKINIASIYTSSYNIINNGIYTDANNPMMDIIHVGDYVKVNNQVRLISSINYGTKVITVTNNLTYAASGNVSVNRVIGAGAQDVFLFGPITGQQYVPQLTTESGDYITTEDENTISIN